MPWRPPPPIRISGLVKTYGPTRALEGLDLTVGAGEVHGLLGPNGAGKTTTIRILLGLLRRDAGEVDLLGGDPWADRVALHRRLRYVPGEVNLWPNLSGGEMIDLLARLHGGIDAGRRAELVERLELDPTRKWATYSKGQPPEGRDRGRLRVRRRAADPRRAQVRTHPVGQIRVAVSPNSGRCSASAAVSA